MPLSVAAAVFLQERTIARLSMGLAGCIFIGLTVLIVVQRRGASALLARLDNDQIPDLGLGI